MRDFTNQAIHFVKSLAFSAKPRIFFVVALLLFGSACVEKEPARPVDAAVAGTSITSARVSVDELDSKIDQLNRKFGRAFWLADTYPSPDAQSVRASVEDLMRDTHIGGLSEIERQYGDAAHENSPGRKLMHIGHRFPHPMPADQTVRAALTLQIAELSQRFEALGICYNENCYSPAEAEARMQEINDPAEREALWMSLRATTAEQAREFESLRESLNAAAREWGYSNMGDWLVARYERPEDEWVASLENLSADIEPLAGALRCHVASSIGAEGDKIPADSLRSLWGRDWTHLHDAVRGGLPPYQPLPLAVDNRFDTVEDMVRWGESTYVAAGFPPLPESFWAGSQFTRPDRELSACPRFGANVDWFKDVRLTMCGELNREDLLWSQGILAFLYYDLAFAEQDWVFRDPPHLGFHFANSDAMELALTPEFLLHEGLIKTLPSEDARISEMLHSALRIIPRIGYGIAADRWRQESYANVASREDLNERWSQLRERHQGVTTPARSSDTVEPLAHILIAQIVELTPSALGEVLQYQFYKEACDSSGHEGPLHKCSFYGGESVADRLWPVLEKGASEPWYDVLESYTGSSEMSAAPLLEYFEPLREWLNIQNEDRKCGASLLD